MNKTSRVARTALVAAAYAVLTFAFSPLSFGPIQLRISEALCILPFFMGEAVIGLTLGCFLANVIGMSFGLTLPWDVLVGTAATFIASYMAAKIKNKWLLPLPAVVINALFVGAMLTYVLVDGMEALPLWYNILTVGAGQAVACYGAGLPLFKMIEKLMKKKQHKEEN